MNLRSSDAPVTPVERSGGLYPSHRPAASFAPPSGPTCLDPEGNADHVGGFVCWPPTPARDLRIANGAGERSGTARPTSSRGLNERCLSVTDDGRPLVEGTGSTGGTTSEEEQ